MSQPATPRRFLVVGLGNPGRAYEHTPHNIGSESITFLASELGLILSRRSQQAYWNTARLPSTSESPPPCVDQAVILNLARPATYMNECGKSVRSLVEARNVELSNLLVVWDHMDLPLGQLRMRPSGGSGGHKGMRSIISYLGTQDFPRLCVGVGRPPGRMDPRAYVLRRFSQAELADSVEALKVRVGEAVVYWLRNGIEAAMNHFNSKP